MDSEQANHSGAQPERRPRSVARSLEHFRWAAYLSLPILSALLIIRPNWLTEWYASVMQHPKKLNNNHPTASQILRDAPAPDTRADSAYLSV